MLSDFTWEEQKARKLKISHGRAVQKVQDKELPDRNKLKNKPGPKGRGDTS